MLRLENSPKKRKLYICLALLVILGLFLFRFVDMEKDLPPFGIAFYQPIDEGAYSNMAINHKVFGSINPTPEETGGPETYLTGNFLTNLLGNLLSIAGFAVFGNNYYGLRFGYVLLSLANLVCLYFVLNCIRIKYAKSSNMAVVAMLAFLLWMVLDFSFLVNARVAEPSSSRMLFVQLITLVFLAGEDKSIRKYAVMGFLTTVSVFFIYITNFFMYLACGFTLLLGWKKYGGKVFWKQVGAFVAGTLIAFVLAEIYYVVFFQTEAVYNSLTTVFAFGSNEDSASAFTEAATSFADVMEIIRVTWLNYFSANSFIYNLPTVVVFLLMIPVAVRLTIKEKSLDIFFLYMVVFSFFLQSFISSDCITRKLIIVFPAVMTLIYLYVVRFDDILQTMKTVMPIKIGNTHLNWKILLTIRWVAWSLTLILTIVTVVGVVYYRLVEFEFTAPEYGPRSTLVLIVFGFVPMVIAFGIVAVSLVKQVLRKRKRAALLRFDFSVCKRLCAPLLIAMILCNTAFAIRYVWLYDSHSERDVMIALGNEANDRYVFGGGYQLGYCLYNDMIPIVTTSKNTVDLLLEYEESINLDYDFSEGLELRNVMEYLYDGHERIDFYKIAIYNRSFATFGLSRNIALYEAVPAGEPAP